MGSRRQPPSRHPAARYPTERRPCMGLHPGRLSASAARPENRKIYWWINQAVRGRCFGRLESRNDAADPPTYLPSECATDYAAHRVNICNALGREYDPESRHLSWFAFNFTPSESRGERGYHESRSKAGSASVVGSCLDPLGSCRYRQRRLTHTSPPSGQSSPRSNNRALVSVQRAK